MSKKHTILVVEDEKDYREILVDAISAKGFLTLQAGDGQEGVLLALAKHPDLILFDLMMPKMDGMTAFKKVREDIAWGADVPVIILTNLNATDEGLVEDVVKCKPYHYLIKSNSRPRDIIQKIEEILKT